MIRFFALAPLFALTLLGSAHPVAALCKEQCIKHCMGNDTPTERANCLKNENCEGQAACPGGSGLQGTTTGTMTIDPSNPPKTKYPWLQTAPTAVFTTQ
jgi:hypothetical protein